MAFRFPKLRQGVLFNNIHLELLSEKSYDHSTNVRQQCESTRAHLRVMKNCEISARRPAVTPSPRGKNYFLQNKLPMSSRHAEPVRKKLLFAKQTADVQSSRRARAEKTTFCKTKPRRSAVTSSSCRKNYFLQNKTPAVSRHAEPTREKLLFAKQTAGGQPSRRARAEKTTFCKTNRRRPALTSSSCRKNYFLQNKTPAVSRHAEPTREKLLFAKHRSVTTNPAKCQMHGLAVGGGPESTQVGTRVYSWRSSDSQVCQTGRG